MSPSLTLATAERVLRQLRRDRRTLALVFVVPPSCSTSSSATSSTGRRRPSTAIGGPLVGLFPFISMFLVTSIAMLRERTTGTLERLMSMPIGKLDLLLGYGLAFAAGRAPSRRRSPRRSRSACSASTRRARSGSSSRSPSRTPLLGMALGLFLSAFARTEFQAVQFMPAFVLPQILLGGLLVPREQMAEPLEWLSHACCPLTYAYDALAQVTQERQARRGARRDVGVVAAASSSRSRWARRPSAAAPTSRVSHSQRGNGLRDVSDTSRRRV